MSKFTRRTFLKSAAATSFLTSSLSLPYAAYGDKDAILVGGLHDLSGALDFAGIPMNQVMSLAVDEINVKGGVLGKEVKQVVYLSLIHI